jgi:hypothetical protein
LVFCIDMDQGSQASFNDEPERERFPKAYDPSSPEVRERRRKLFEDIARTRTPETDEAMNKIASRFMSKLTW